MRRIITTIALALGVVTLTAAPALAHVELASSDPVDGSTSSSPIEEITLEFSVESVIAGEGVNLYGADGSPIAAEVTQVSGTVVVVTPADPLQEGVYAVTWAMQSGDAHPVTGGIEFSVEIPAAPATTAAAQTNDPATPTTIAPTATESGTLLASVLEPAGSPVGSMMTTIGRAASIAATLVGLGAFAFGALVLRGSRREVEVVGYWMRRSGAAILLALPLVLVGTLVDAGAEGVGAIGLGLALQAAGGLALLSGTRIMTIPDDPGPHHPYAPESSGVATLRDQRFRLASSPAAMVGMGALVLAYALDGHSGALEPVWLIQVASVVHVIAAAIWVGGVALLGRTLLGRARAGVQLDTGSLVVPFSVIAAAAVTAVGVAGAVMAFVIADGLGTFFTTPWGWAMLAKLGFVGVAGAIGAYNHFVLVPMLKADADHPVASEAILRAVRVEIVCLVLAATITGALVGLSAS